jgi:hypothetical protein
MMPSLLLGKLPLTLARSAVLPLAPLAELTLSAESASFLVDFEERRRPEAQPKPHTTIEFIIWVERYADRDQRVIVYLET